MPTAASSIVPRERLSELYTSLYRHFGFGYYEIYLALVHLGVRREDDFSPDGLNGTIAEILKRNGISRAIEIGPQNKSVLERLAPILKSIGCEMLYAGSVPSDARKRYGYAGMKKGPARWDEDTDMGKAGLVIARNVFSTGGQPSGEFDPRIAGHIGRMSRAVNNIGRHLTPKGVAVITEDNGVMPIARRRLSRARVVRWDMGEFPVPPEFEPHHQAAVDEYGPDHWIPKAIERFPLAVVLKGRTRAGH